MPFHWQSNVNVQHVGVDDMVLLRHLSENDIVENLRKRLANRGIFTYIGPVLISVNPFKEMPYFTEKEMEMYRGSAQYENPPHIYALADRMYRNMVIDNERQCVIISGESGAGKTVNAKFIMNYIARISGGGDRVQHVKEVIIQSNPLLEAFGNAATLRNWNSSRFGKYVEIQFGIGGEPIGGKISNFLLEKSRVVGLNAGERNFHIFYQLIAGADEHIRNNFGISTIDYYNYLNQSNCHKAHGIDDAQEYAETLNAMQVVGIAEEDQLQILQIVSAILHIGNICFVEEGNYAAVASDDYLQFPAYLLGLNTEEIKNKVTKRKLESKWGKTREEIDVTLNVEQAAYTRDAWVKALYSKLFDYLVGVINNELNTSVSKTKCQRNEELSIGILDIYGFEIFEDNGFEQFCINFVNEKLQQIFIELTLKAEQEEYVSEGILWTPIEYFNNKVVCDLIETRRPPGIMCLLDDVCAQIHGQSEGVDAKLLVKLSQHFAQHDHFRAGSECFIITHYAGEVNYKINGFCDRNRDTLYADLIQLMQQSTSKFVRGLFADEVTTVVSGGAKSKPTSFSTKIRNQANQLVESLMKCTPHYIRCIKPNETKKALEFDSQRVLHQVKYLGLKENICVRRAGFAYRRSFEKFLWRYAILSVETWPHYKGSARKGCEVICHSANLSSDQFQLGKTKIFIKSPESLFLLEELREQKYNSFARVIQKAFRKYVSSKYYIRQKEEASDLFYGRKERRRYSINRNFVGDYIGVETNRSVLQTIVGRRERIDFAHAVNKYDRLFRAKKVELLLTKKHLTIVERELEKRGPNKGKMMDIVKRQIPLDKIYAVGLSPFQDDFILIFVNDEFTSVLETPLKTEFLSALSKRYKEKTSRKLDLEFKESHMIFLKKSDIISAFDKPFRHIQFHREDQPLMNGAANGCGGRQISPTVRLKAAGKVLNIYVAPGLPNTTRPSCSTTNGRSHVNGGIHGNNLSGPRVNKLLSQQQHNNDHPVVPTAHFNGQQLHRATPVRPASPRMTTAQQQLNHDYQEPQLVPVKKLNGHVMNGLQPVMMPQNVNITAAGWKPPQFGKSNGNVTNSPNSAPQAKPRPLPKPKPPVQLKGPTVKTLYPYQAQDSDELSFLEGQIIELMQKDESGWWQGRMGAKVGLFPANYVKEQ